MPPNDADRFASKTNLRIFFAISAMTLAMIFLLRAQNRIWWCKLGDYAPATLDAWTTHTSQHVFDPYSLTHVLHGILFFWLIGALFGKCSFGARLALALFVEAVWEVLENSNAVIEHYRENTASLDYFGDSILNSVGDLGACGVGFYIAARLGWRRSLAVFLMTEIVLLVWIRDSLLLNVLMLIYPLDSIKTWQVG